jgi:hypothetical protein
MQNYFYESDAKNKIPTVKFDAKQGTLEFEGISRSENARAFYSPIFNWVHSYCDAPKQETTLKINLSYFNTGSAKCLMDIIQTLIEAHQEGKTHFKIEWYYQEEDEDMQQTGSNFSNLLNFPVEFIELPSN